MLQVKYIIEKDKFLQELKYTFYFEVSGMFSAKCIFIEV